ncbi:MAG: SUMF1/EgtB/PvdO family nonheme iron enzyme, partial [Xanthomonadales bacterium]|nr:SUMF1/EgtB/PvdO family nonheme iron enzyme [Xanthomonadales bacterium]
RHWPAVLDAAMLDFSRDASMLELAGDDLRFSHQLLQEYLSSQVLCEASRPGGPPAHDFWPVETWWQRSGWEVVAEIAAESCAGDVAARNDLLNWLATANPEVAAAAWRAVGQPPLPPELLASIAARWRPALTDIDAFPDARARAAAGRALALLGLDSRPGVGLNAEGLPDIDWVEIPGPAPFRYQDAAHPGLPRFWIARYPVTVAQFQAFVDAGGYRNDRWWDGLAKRIDAPDAPIWPESNMPRCDSSWYEAVAFCRWLSDALGFSIHLPTEHEWERVARGPAGLVYPWGDEYHPGNANVREGEGGLFLGATCTVGLYPQGASAEGALDLAGNVWEWCLNEYDQPDRIGLDGEASRVLRGGAWGGGLRVCRAANRYHFPPGGRVNDGIGFRVCRGSPTEPLPTVPLCQTIESIDVNT